MLTLGWIGLLTLSLVVAVDLWPREAAALFHARAGTSVGVALGEALRQGAPQFLAAGASVLGAPLFLFSWLALPKRDRATLPIVLDLWVFVTLAAFSDWLPHGETASFALVCVLALLIGEIVRSLLTAMVRHGTRPFEAREASV